MTTETGEEMDFINNDTISDILDKFFDAEILDCKNESARKQLARISLQSLQEIFVSRSTLDKTKQYAEGHGNMVLEGLLRGQNYRLLKRFKNHTATVDIHEFIMALENGQASNETYSRLQIKSDLDKSLNSQSHDQTMLDSLIERIEVLEEKSCKFEAMYESMLCENLKLRQCLRVNNCQKENDELDRKRKSPHRLRGLETNSINDIINTPIRTSRAASREYENKRLKTSILKDSNSPSIMSNLNKERTKSPGVTFSKLVEKCAMKSDGFTHAGGNRRRFKPTVVKGKATNDEDALPTTEKKIAFCASGLASNATNDQVKNYVNKFATVDEVTLIENRANLYKFKMFKIVVGVSQIEAMNNADNWPINLSVRRFRLKRTTPNTTLDVSKNVCTKLSGTSNELNNPTQL